MKLIVTDEEEVEKAKQCFEKFCYMNECSMCRREDMCRRVFTEILEQSRSAKILKKVYKILVKSQGKDIPLVGTLFEKIWNEVKFVDREKME